MITLALPSAATGRPSPHPCLKSSAAAAVLLQCCWSEDRVQTAWPTTTMACKGTALGFTACFACFPAITRWVRLAFKPNVGAGRRFVFGPFWVRLELQRSMRAVQRRCCSQAAVVNHSRPCDKHRAQRAGPGNLLHQHDVCPACRARRTAYHHGQSGTVVDRSMYLLPAQHIHQQHPRSCSGGSKG